MHINAFTIERPSGKRKGYSFSNFYLQKYVKDKKYQHKYKDRTDTLKFKVKLKLKWKFKLKL